MNRAFIIGLVLWTLYGVWNYLRTRVKAAAQREADERAEAKRRELVQGNLLNIARDSVATGGAKRMRWASGQTMMQTPICAQYLLDWLDSLPEAYRERVIQFGSESKKNYLNLAWVAMGEEDGLDREDLKALKKLLPREAYVEVIHGRRRALARNRVLTSEGEVELAEPKRAKRARKAESPRESSTERRVRQEEPGLATRAISSVAVPSVTSEPDRYECEVAENRVLLFRNGRQFSSRALPPDATGRCSMEADWLLFERKSKGAHSARWDAVCVTRSGNIGGGNSERTARRAVRLRMQGKL